ncbi:MAG: GGDEF domain-containing protein [Chloroflexi bacterium]|nr:GGDEF domain-containing protein [Chloroflexota bacterium]
MPRSRSLDDGVLFRALMDATSDSVYVKDRDCRLVRVSRSMVKSLGFTDPADLIGKTDADLFGPEFAERTSVADRRIMDADEPSGGVVESRHKADGSVNWTLTSKLPLHDQAGRVVGLIGITREINELKHVEMSLQYLATHDALTTLPNRYLLMDRLNHVLARSERERASFAVLFVDIDDFKGINDKRGHATGDTVLRAVADRLRASIRTADTVARVGGDEFVLVLEGTDRARATDIATRIRLLVANPIDLPGRPATVTVTVGIGVYPGHADDAEGLIAAADKAMYRQKKTRKDGHLVRLRDGSTTSPPIRLPA